MTQRVLGTFLYDVPEEIVHAAGLLPFALLGGNKTENSLASIPSFACSLIIGTMNDALQNRLDFLDGIVVPHFCDSSRPFLHIWQKTFPEQFSDLLRLPMKLDSKGAKGYLVGELKRFKEAIERAFEVRVSDEALSRSIGTYNENRRYLRTIKARRAKDPYFMTNFDFFSLIRSSMRLLKEEHNAILKNILDIGNNSSTKTAHREPISKVFLSGKIAEPLEILKWMDELRIVVADDDLAVGTRYFSYDVDDARDPLDALAESYFHRIPSSHVEGPEDRVSYLLRRVRENDLKGVAFIHLKFCDPLVYDYPNIKKTLDREGIPSLLLETDLQTLATGQIKTKLQAFAEILEGI
jgi:bcr-type benzoyl-CoA reductase subunit C